MLQIRASPGDAVVKNLPANAEDSRNEGSIPESRRFPREVNGNPLQYSCLENFMDRGAWQTPVHGVTKSQTQLSTHTYVYSNIRMSLYSMTVKQANMI